MKNKLLPRAALLAALAALATNAQAATLTWDGGGDGFTWTDASNWDTNTAPNTTGTPAYDAIIFGATDPGTVNVGASQNALSLTFNNASAFTLDHGTNAFNQRGNIFVTSGSHIITSTGAGKVAFASSGSINLAAGTGLSIRGFDFNTKNVSITNSTGSGTANLTLIQGAATYSPATFSVNTGIALDLQANTGNGGTQGGQTFSGAGSITNTSGTTSILHVGATGLGGASFSGNITGNVRFVKGRSNNNDLYTQTLSGTNSYTGTTTVQSGTLLINGSHTGGGNYLVNGKAGSSGGDAILGGNGSINVGANTITIGDASASSSVGRLQAGSAALTIGTLNTTAASLDFAAESIFTVDLNTTGSNTIDLVNHTGSVSITSGAILSLNQLSGFTAGTFFNGTSYTFLNYSGSIAGSFMLDSGSAALLTANNYVLFNDTVGTQLQLISAIPEPSSFAALAGFATLGFVALRRRRSAL